MKAHKYWSIGALITMIGTFYTGYKGSKSGHRYFACSTLICMIMSMYTGHKMISGNKRTRKQVDNAQKSHMPASYILVYYPLDKNIKLFFYLNNHLIYALLRSDPAIQNPVLLFLTLTFTIPPLLYFPPVFLFFYYLKSFYDQNRLP